eukprot:6454970-Amphidinium_carterae.1
MAALKTHTSADLPHKCFIDQLRSYHQSDPGKPNNGNCWQQTQQTKLVRDICSQLTNMRRGISQL